MTKNLYSVIMGWVRTLCELSMHESCASWVSGTYHGERWARAFFMVLIVGAGGAAAMSGDVWEKELSEAAQKGDVKKIKLLCDQTPLGAVQKHPADFFSIPHEFEIFSCYSLAACLKKAFPLLFLSKKDGKSMTSAYALSLPRFRDKHPLYNAARIAALSEHTPVLVHFFENKGLDLCVVDKEGETIWAYANRQGCSKTVKWLREYLGKTTKNPECTICFEDLTTTPDVCDYYCLTIVCQMCKKIFKKDDPCPGCRRPMSDLK